MGLGLGSGGLGAWGFGGLRGSGSRGLWGLNLGVWRLRV